MLHIGSDRFIPKRDIIAVLDAKAQRRARCGMDLESVDMGACGSGAIRSVIVCEHGGREKLFGSPISATALRTRSLF